MELKEARAAIQAVLFASGDPISADRIAAAMDIDSETVLKLLRGIADDFDSDDSGICVIKLNDEYQMCAKPNCSDYVRRALDLRRRAPLSPAAMEVLAVIAYNQPVTKSFVEQVRGVDCSSIISGLCTKDLIEEKGRLDLPGRPLLYGTTHNFLKCFGVESVNELPELDIPEKDNYLQVNANEK